MPARRIGVTNLFEQLCQNQPFNPRCLCRNYGDGLVSKIAVVGLGMQHSLAVLG
jgi:hypothetical protein